MRISAIGDIRTPAQVGVRSPGCSWTPACAGVGFRQTGFTLIELLVVLAIIGMAGAAVALAMPDPRGDLRQEAERLAARVRAAQDAAVIEARDMALWIGPSGYGFERREREGWRPVLDKAFRPQLWSEGTRPSRQARVRFDTTGQSEPLDLSLVREDARAAVHFSADGSIRVE